MDKDKAALERLKNLSKVEDPKTFIKLFLENVDSFSKLEKTWFSHKDKTVEVSTEDYVEDIVSYVDKAIIIHIRAIPHHKVNEIVLLFSKEEADRIEPIIRICFDTNTVEIAIDDLWESELELDRELKNGCVSLAEMIWGEYRATVDCGQLTSDAEKICRRLRALHPDIPISYRVD